MVDKDLPAPSPDGDAAAPATTLPAVRLRSHPTELTEPEARTMLTAGGFFLTDWNPDGRFYNALVDHGNGTLSDHRTGLMWQQSGADRQLGYQSAQDYVAGLNRAVWAGHGDWRLPTLVEGASLLESEKRNRRLYIDPLFDPAQRWIWTSDGGRSGAAWVVNFVFGYVDQSAYALDHFVRVCRDSRP